MFTKITNTGENTGCEFRAAFKNKLFPDEKNEI